mgnify:CR=1 FL=1
MLNKIRYRIEIFRQLLPYMAGVKRFFILNFILSIITMLLGFVNPQFYKIFIDQVIIEGDFTKMPVVLIGYLGIFFVGLAISYIKNYANYTLVNTTLYRTKYQIWNRMFDEPFQYYETVNIGDMKMQLEDDTNQINAFSEYQTTGYVIAYATMIISAGWLFLIDWRLSLFSIVAIPLTFWLDNIISKREEKLNDSNRENDQCFSSWLHVSIHGWREIKALNIENIQRHKLVRFLHNFALYFAKWINYWTARVLVIPKIKDEFFMRFGLYFLGGFFIIEGKLKISDLLVFASYYGMLSDAVKTVSSTDADLQSNMPFINRLLASLKPLETDNQRKRIVPDTSNTIVIKDVSFLYPHTKREVLRNFNLTINKGERIAITGESGCGKTTLLKLITGLLSPTSGSVSFSGIDLKEIDLSSMHRRFGFVMQENILFNTTIRENLLYGKIDAQDEEIFEACRKAYILDFINSLPNGLDTVIGEKGIKLSGGQRQRLVLARLFLRDVDIFIFDEATNALDQYSENIVHDAIRDIGNDKTIIIVAHRESSMRLCDKKIVLKRIL